jgi:hypothetical protein
MDDARTEVGRVPKNSREIIVVSLSEYRGTDLVDLRIHSDYHTAGDYLPTGKGVSLRIERLPLLIEQLEQARAEAVRQGLIP